MQLHLRIAKALAEDDGLFDVEEERASTQSDWAEDCTRFGLKVSADLDKGSFIQAMYQLTDVWAEDHAVSYASFLNGPSRLSTLGILHSRSFLPCAFVWAHGVLSS